MIFASAVACCGRGFAAARPTQNGATTQVSAAGPVRATPIVLLQRRHLADWSTARRSRTPAQSRRCPRARRPSRDYLAGHGASFFDELLGGTRLLHTELEDALGELVASGLVTSDSFSGLRALLVPSSKRPPPHRRRGRRASLFGIADAGRWAIVRRTRGPTDAKPRTGDGDVVELVARTLLKRYGVVCWRLLANEAAWLPPWRELLRVFHRLEARGEIRGGRFIAGLSGEQFALPEAVASLRAIRQKKPDGQWICGLRRRSVEPRRRRARGHDRAGPDGPRACSIAMACRSRSSSPAKSRCSKRWTSRPKRSRARSSCAVPIATRILRSRMRRRPNRSRR